MLGYKSQRGDTIVEVIVAFTIFAMIAVGGLSLMNQGTATAQRTLEITLVRQQIDAQADTLRMVNREVVAGSANEGFTKNWKEITDQSVDISSPLTPFDDISDSKECKKPGSVIDTKAFAINPLKLNNYNQSDTPIIKGPDISNAVTYAQIQTDNNDPSTFKPQGIWIVAVKGDGGKYYDFHLRACWISPGQGTPMKLGTIVRLYDSQI